MSDKRLYGIDLFKALAMFLVVVLHVNTLGTAFDSSAPSSAQWWLTDGMMTAAYCCVDCFALATGFLMAERAFRPGRIVSLWLQVAFYAVVTTVVWYFAVPGAVGIKDIVSAFFPVLTSKYWYFSAYFVLFFFTPFINAMLHALKRRSACRSVCFSVAAADLQAAGRYPALGRILLFLAGSTVHHRRMHKARQTI
jgi:surface polysaccharide O-acyltransferase-like enzyme